MIKRFEKCILCLLILVIVTQTKALGFPDVDKNTSYGKAIYAMAEKGYIQGFEDGKFRPEGTLTRAQFVTIINKIFMYYVEAEPAFSDVKPNDWFYHDVQTGVQAGYIIGMGDGTFAPNKAVTREEVCVMLNSILNFGDILSKPDITDKVSPWAKDSVDKVVGMYFFTLEPGGKFRGTEPITRAETCEALDKIKLDIDFEERFEPIDLNALAREEVEKRLKEIIECMEKTIIPQYTDEKVLEVGKMAVESMKNYLKDANFDYVTAAQQTYEVYRKFNGTQARMFKKPIYNNIEIENLSLLFDFFYCPQLDSILKN